MSLGLDDYNPRYVYRVLRPNEDPNKDITCQAPYSSRTISEHIETGLRIPSKFISTTSSLEGARKWLETSDGITARKYGNRRTTIVRIDLNIIKQHFPNIADSAIDLTCPYNRNSFLQKDIQKKYAAAYREVLFTRRIPSEAVSIEYIKGKGSVRNETNTATNVLHKNVTLSYTGSLQNNQLGTYHNTGNTRFAATSLREMQSSDSDRNSSDTDYSDSDYEGISSEAFEPTQSQTPQTLSQLLSRYSNNTASQQQTRSVQSGASSYQWSNRVPSTYSNATENQSTRPTPSSTANFDSNYFSYRNTLRDQVPTYKPSRTPIPLPRVNRYSDYEGISSKSFEPTQNRTSLSLSQTRSPYSDNTTSQRQTRSVQSGASSYQWSNRAPSTYSNATENQTTRPTPSSTANFDYNYFSYRNTLPSPPPPRENRSIWQRILSFFSLV